MLGICLQKPHVSFRLPISAAVVAWMALSACQPAESELGRPSPAPAVGTTRIEIAGPDGGVMPVQLWYPASQSTRAEAQQGHPTQEFEPVGPRRNLIQSLLDRSPPGCSSRVMHAAFDAPVLASGAPFPVVVYSHHLEGMRFALFSIAEGLAKRGFVVAAPDHVGRSLFDRTDNLMTADPIGLALRFRFDDMAVRSAQLRRVIDALFDPSTPQLPDDLRGRLDTARLGMLGHSEGSGSAGVATAADTRIKAGAYLSFPPARAIEFLDVFGQPTGAELRVPALFMFGQEDGVTGTLGNEVIRQQFAAHPAPAYLVEVPEAGHWSFADDCGLIPDFADGCGRGKRIAAPNAAFNYLDSNKARAIAVRYVVDFFQSQLLGAPVQALGPQFPAADALVQSNARP